MHTANTGTCTWNYNDDFSGNVEVRVVTKWGTEQISVPAEELLQFVALSFVLPARIRALEEASPRALLESHH